MAKQFTNPLPTINKTMLVIREKFGVNNNIELVVTIINLKSTSALVAGDPAE
jgi:hypothetical protein